MLKRLRMIKDTASAIRKIHAAGGPKRVKLVRIEHPKGLVLTSSAAVVEVATQSGEVIRFTTALPLPFLYAWGYRLARGLHVPFVSDIDPEDISVDVPVPGWAWPGSKPSA